MFEAYSFFFFYSVNPQEYVRSPRCYLFSFTRPVAVPIFRERPGSGFHAKLVSEKASCSLPTPYFLFTPVSFSLPSRGLRFSPPSALVRELVLLPRIPVTYSTYLPWPRPFRITSLCTSDCPEITFSCSELGAPSRPSSLRTSVARYDLVKGVRPTLFSTLFFPSHHELDLGLGPLLSLRKAIPRRHRLVCGRFSSIMGADQDQKLVSRESILDVIWYLWYSPNVFSYFPSQLCTPFPPVGGFFSIWDVSMRYAGFLF